MGEELEYLEIEEESEQIFNKLSRFPFPVVAVKGDWHFIFNKSAASLFLNQKYVEFRLNSNYVLFLLSNQKERGMYTISYDRRLSAQMTVPIELRARGLQRGTYKLYKCKGGFCIKKNEPLETF